MSIHVTLPDGNALELPDGASGADVAAAIGPASRGRRWRSRSTASCATSRARSRTARASRSSRRRATRALALIRHDAAHVLAAAAMELYPGVKIAIGPAIENGFYYDFDFPDGTSISEDDLPAIEARMREHIRAAEPFVREEVPVDGRAGALRRGAPALQGRADRRPRARPVSVQTVSLYTNGPFTDLCRGPHAPSTATVKAFALQSVAGAYWRGDSTRPMLTRIYGTAFFSKEDLEAHLERLELARARDHRRLGRELGLFHFSDWAAGSAFWTPQGTTLWNTLRDLMSELTRRPRLHRGQDAAALRRRAVADLGPLGQVPRQHVRDQRRRASARPQADELPRPLRALRDGAPLLPRAAGALLGAGAAPPQRALGHPARAAAGAPVRDQDDAPHLLHRGADRERGRRTSSPSPARSTSCSARDALRALDAPAGADRRRRAVGPRRGGARPTCSAGAGIDYQLNPGDGAFYGPKIDMHMTDSLGRSWQLGTVQLDYNAPERFDLAYTGADNAEHRPVMIHRAILGSLERFIGILIEDRGGVLPVWLAPVQAIVLPITDRQNDAARRRARRAARRRPARRARRPLGVGRRARSATPSCARSPTCSWSASARRKPGPSPCASTARATPASSRPASSSSGCAPRPPSVRVSSQPAAGNRAQRTSPLANNSSPADPRAAILAPLGNRNIHHAAHAPRLTRARDH